MVAILSTTRNHPRSQWVRNVNSRLNSGCTFGVIYLWAYFTPFKASVDDRTVLYRGIDRDDGVEYWIEFEATNMHVHGLVVPK
jgi:hypothetical protein